MRFAILGCGARGQEFAGWIAAHPADARIVAIAEPDEGRRQLVGDAHAVPTDLRFARWEELLARPQLADAIINTTMDALHAASALAALGRGYHMLLEKPMATTLEDCAAIDDARRRHERLVCVCHSLRYHPVYSKVKQLLDDGAIGLPVSFDQLEGVEPVHQSHSFVRGNWSRERDGSFMLLQKSCHDIDVLMYLMGRGVARVSSFGGLSHFTPANKPAGAPARCTDGCPVEESCPYSSLKVYARGESWGRYIGLDRLTPEQRLAFLAHTEYGRCVYDGGNDAVDHQVVNFEFDGGATGTFTMTAFAPAGRMLRLHGTHGFIAADVQRHRIDLHRFWGRPQHEVIEVPQQPGPHAGGDASAIASLVEAIRRGDSSPILTGTDESLRSHAVVFAAEQARREGGVARIVPPVAFEPRTNQPTVELMQLTHSWK